MLDRKWTTIAVLLACGCGSDDEVAYPTVTLDTADGTVILSEAPSLTLARDGVTLLHFDPQALQLGVVEQVDDDTNYDPYMLYVPHPIYTPAFTVTWLSPTGASLKPSQAGEQTLQLVYPQGHQATLTVRAEEPGRFSLLFAPSGGRTAFMRLRPRSSGGEGFYGLGEYFDAVEHSGKVRAMHLVGEDVESAYNDAHVPVPILVGTNGWGLFVESPYPGAFAVAATEPQLIEAAFGTGTASPAGLAFHLFAAAHPLDVTRHYYDVTGYPKLPARWALGPVVWRDENDDQAQVESDLDMIRDLDLATSGYWIDRPYATGVNTFDFAAAQFPDPTAMIAKMHELGFRTALWHTPYLDAEDAATAELRATAEAEGYYPLENGILFNHWGKPVDLTNPEAVAWWQSLLGNYVNLGVDGFKLDYGEDVIAGPLAKRTPWRFADGSDERSMHSQFQRFYHQSYAELLPAEGGFLLCRGGTYGDQTNGIIIWPGDLDANFSKRGELVTDGEQHTSVGGLPASIIAGLSLGPSGFPFYGADTGGYRHSPVDNETFSRWFEQTALSTVMQIGTSANDVAWELGGENGFDEAMLDRYRQYTRLHLRLWPYLWSYAQQLLSDGRPIQRALGLAHPELGSHPDDIYLLGDHLLVAPVVARGAKSKLVTFPEGSWVHWFTGEQYQGPSEQDVPAPIGRLPLFLDRDAIVPLLRPTIDSLAPTTDPARVDSYATDPGLLYARAVTGGNGDFTLFDGGSLAQRSEDGSSSLSWSAGSELNQGAVFELLAAGPPTNVSGLTKHDDLAALEAGDAGYYYDANRKTLWVKLVPTVTNVTISWG